MTQREREDISSEILRETVLPKGYTDLHSLQPALGPQAELEIRPPESLNYCISSSQHGCTIFALDKAKHTPRANALSKNEQIPKTPCPPIKTILSHRTYSLLEDPRGPVLQFWYQHKQSSFLASLPHSLTEVSKNQLPNKLLAIKFYL